jgi:hypothetical protein
LAKPSPQRQQVVPGLSPLRLRTSMGRALRRDVHKPTRQQNHKLDQILIAHTATHIIAHKTFSRREHASAPAQNLATISPPTLQALDLVDSKPASGSGPSDHPGPKPVTWSRKNLK